MQESRRPATRRQLSRTDAILCDLYQIHFLHGMLRLRYPAWYAAITRPIADAKSIERIAGRSTRYAKCMWKSDMRFRCVRKKRRIR